jgi:hypothetical protein
MAPLARRGFGPWCRDERDLDRALTPQMTWPLFVRVMWQNNCVARKTDWRLCAACHEAAQAFDRDAPPAAPDPLAARDWLREIIEDVERSGPRPAPAPPVDCSEEVVSLAQQLARDLAALPPGGSVSMLAGGFARHGEKYGLAAANIVLAGTISDANLHMIRMRAVELLAQWDDPRAVPFLVAGMENGGLVNWIAQELAKKGDQHALLPALQKLAYLLKLQDRYRVHWIGPEAQPPYQSGADTRLNAVKPFVKSLNELMDLHWCGTSIVWLMRMMAQLGEEWGRRTCREIYSFSLFHHDIVYCAEELHSFDDPVDQGAVALAVAYQAFSTGFSPKEFPQRLDYLARHSSAAGWWAMDRFVSTAQQWKDQIPVVRKVMNRLSKPSQPELATLESRYGPFLDQTLKKPSSGSRCFIATAAMGTDQAEEVIRLREFRDRVLRRARLGRAFIAMYEAAAPRLANLIRPSARGRLLVRTLLVRPASRIAGQLTRLSERKGHPAPQSRLGFAFPSRDRKKP